MSPTQSYAMSHSTKCTFTDCHSYQRCCSRYHHGECRYADYYSAFFVMFTVVTLTEVTLAVVILTVVMLTVVRLAVVIQW